MFISNDEKRYLFDQIKLLTAVSEKLESMESRVIFWEAKIRSLEAKFDTLYQVVASKQKAKKPLTPEQRAKQREYMKRYTEKKKAEKAQNILKALS